MISDLKDKRQLLRFLSISALGTAADYALALLLAGTLSTPYAIASTLGFILGSIINYVGHNIFSYEHTDQNSISLRGYGKYFLVEGLAYFTPLPFWFILLVAIGASFVANYVISTLWVFRKPG